MTTPVNSTTIKSIRQEVRESSACVLLAYLFSELFLVVAGNDNHSG